MSALGCVITEVLAYVPESRLSPPKWRVRTATGVVRVIRETTARTYLSDMRRNGYPRPVYTVRPPGLRAVDEEWTAGRRMSARSAAGVLLMLASGGV